MLVNEARPADLWTPLHSAAANGHTAACKALIAWGASLNAQTVAGETPLTLSAARDHVGTFALLLASSPLACVCGSTSDAVCASCERIKLLDSVAAPAVRSSHSFLLMKQQFTGKCDLVNAPDARVRLMLASMFILRSEHASCPVFSSYTRLCMLPLWPVMNASLPHWWLQEPIRPLRCASAFGMRVHE